MRPTRLELRPEPAGDTAMGRSSEGGVSGGGACLQGRLAGGSLEQRARAEAGGGVARAWHSLSFHSAVRAVEEAAALSRSPLLATGGPLLCSSS